MRRVISQVVQELGMTSIFVANATDMRDGNARKAFVQSLHGDSELIAVIDLTTASSPGYLLLIDDLERLYGSRLRSIALVDKVFEGLISLLFSRGVGTVLVKPLLSMDLQTRLVGMFQPVTGVDALIAAGRAKLADLQIDEALALSNALPDERGKMHHIALFRGDIQFGLQNYRAAGRQFLMAYLAEPCSFQALMGLARVLRARGRLRGELYWLRKFQRINSLDFDNLIRLGEICLSLDRAEDARKWLDSSVLIARRLLPAQCIFDHQYRVIMSCAERGGLSLARVYADQALRDGNVGKEALVKIAMLRMTRFRDMDGACSIFRLLAVREERAQESRDWNFWATALYNAALCHHARHKDERIFKDRIGVRRACDDILKILEEMPEFGVDDPLVTKNIITIASNPLQPNHALKDLLRKQKRTDNG